MLTNRLDSLRQVTVPVAELEKEGWLLKKGQKRYFVLSNAHLMWFDRPKGEAKGSLPVKEYTVQVKDGGTLKKELVLIPQNDKKGLKPYHLEAEKDQDVIEWAKTLKKVLNFEKEDDAEPTKLGWLEKKGQKRWFLIREGKLYWFNKEQFITADVAKNANGSLDLAECTVASGPDQKQKGNSTNFNFTVKNSKEVYILTAKTEQEKDEWVDALKDNIRWTKRASRERRKLALDDSQSLPEKRGWLTKKGQKRYFVLKDSVLKWYLDSNEKNAERGSLPLLGCVVDINADKLEVSIKDNKGVHYELYAQSFQELDEWYFMLDLSAERAQSVLQGQSLVPRDSIRQERQSRASMEIKQDRGQPPRVSLGAREKALTTVFDPNSTAKQDQTNNSSSDIAQTHSVTESTHPTDQSQTTQSTHPITDQSEQPTAESTHPITDQSQTTTEQSQATITESSQSEPVLHSTEQSQPPSNNEHSAVESSTTLHEETSNINNNHHDDNDNDAKENHSSKEDGSDDDDEIIYDESEQSHHGGHQRHGSSLEDNSDDEPSKTTTTQHTSDNESKVPLVAEKESHDLVESNKSLQQQVEQYEAEIKSLQQRLEKDVKHQSNHSQDDFLHNLQHRLQEESQEKSKLEQQVQHLRDKLHREKQEKDELESQLKLEQQQNHSLQSSLSKERNDHKQEIQSLIGIQSDKSSVESKLQEALAKEADLDIQLKDQKQLNEKFERQSKELENRMQQEKTESSQRQQHMEQEIKELKQKYQDLQSHSDTTIQLLQNNLSQVTQDKENLVAELFTQKNQVTALQIQKERLEEELQLERDRISAVEVQLKDRNESGAVAKSRIAILEAELDEKQKIEQKLFDLKQQYENETKENHRLTSQLVEHKEKSDSLQKLLDSEREAHKREIQTILASSNETDQNNIGKVLSERAELERLLNEEQQKYQQLKKSKEAAELHAKQEQDQSSKQIEEQHHQIETLNKNIKALSDKFSTTQSQLDATESNLKVNFVKVKMADIQQLEADAKQQYEKQNKANQQRVIELESQVKAEQQKQKDLEKSLHDLTYLSKQKQQIEEELKEERNRSQTLQSQLKEKSTHDSTHIKEENEKLKKQLIVKEQSFRSRWRPDYESTQCTKCHSEFGLFNRRHHCRHCGEIFCGDCSSKQAPLSTTNPQLVRVCDTCFSEAGPASHSQRLSAPM